MRLFLISLLALSLMVSSCQDDETACLDSSGTVLYAVGPNQLKWVSDSSVTFVLRDTLGNADTFTRNGFNMYEVRSTYQDECVHESSQFVHNSHSSTVGNSLAYEVMAGPTGHVRVVLRGDTMQVGAGSTSAPTFLHPAGCVLETQPLWFDTVVVSGVAYPEVYALHLTSTSCLQPEEPDTVFWARSFGLIKWVQQDGLTWRMVP